MDTQEAKRHPWDYEAFNYEDVIPPQEIERACGLPRTHKNYNIRRMIEARRIEDKLWDLRQMHAEVVNDGDGLRIIHPRDCRTRYQKRDQKRQRQLQRDAVRAQRVPLHMIEDTQERRKMEKEAQFLAFKLAISEGSRQKFIPVEEAIKEIADKRS